MSTTTTGQRPHRRNASTGTISTNGSIENLLAALPIPHVDNDNTRQHASQQNILLDSPKNQNPNISIIKEKTTNISPSNDPFSTKKQRKPDGSFHSPKSSGLDIRKILYFFVFLWALVVFLSSLFGVGPVDEELLIDKDVPINDHNTIVNETIIDDNKDSPNEETDAWEEIAQDDWEDTTHITENIIPTQNDTGDIKGKFGSSDNSIDSTQIGITNKLKNKKQTKYEISDALNEDSIEVDYSDYTYVTTNPHFTHTDVVESLSISEHEEFVNLQMSQKNIDDSLDHSCGSWQDKYTKLHKEILNGTAPQRYIVENSILSKTDYRVISRGSFGKLAVFRSKQLHSTVLLSTTRTKFLDCTREDAFTTFNRLANEWSII
ncbi:2767_t:CDS:2 [Entrophospora sp. SA101]|nr:2767_t:CDS:2 [Entrophospora sp. SA101]